VPPKVLIPSAAGVTSFNTVDVPVSS